MFLHTELVNMVRQQFAWNVLIAPEYEVAYWNTVFITIDANKRLSPINAPPTHKNI